MSNVKDTKAPRPKATRIKITSSYNAIDSSPDVYDPLVGSGDTVTVTPADNWTDGGLIVIENKSKCVQLVYLHRGTGKVYAYIAKRWNRSSGGERYKEDELKIIGKFQQKVEKPTLGDLGALASIKEKLKQEEKDQNAGGEGAAQ